MINTLEKICGDKRDWVALCKQITPLGTLQAQIDDIASPRGFVAALERTRQQHKFGVIAEVKKASPSKGLIRADFDPAELARAYQQGGASCLSVLTDTPYFQGSDADFRAARIACSLPIIRKDFMVDPYQITESRTLGADCILLILTALDDVLAQELLDCALDLGMDALIEVHNTDEVHRAHALRAQDGRSVIGINNRNLKTLQIDTETCINLAPTLKGAWWVAESGIADAITMQRMHLFGAGGFLIGESLMRQNNVTKALRTLLDEARA
ncbi:MAG: indole-3-glycerol phosphate synthase TrpC [Alphaproteobacteria bacterium]|nr:indole-3-glycerol phosphate synthase TrpC [Alphaproteobacteria bacterium]